MIATLRLLLSLTLSWLLLSAGPTYAQTQKARRNVQVEWEAVEGATQYEVQIVSKEEKGKKPLHFKISEPKWEANIKPGLYSMQVRSFDDRGVPGEWSPASELKVKLQSVIMVSPKPAETINGEHDNSQNVEFSWEPVPSALRYKITVHSKSSSWQNSQELSETTLKLSLPVGEAFEWNVVGIDSKSEEGEVNEAPQLFSIHGPALRKPSIVKPISKFIDEVHWSAVDKAQRYSYELSYRDPETKQWQVIETKPDLTDTQIKLDISRPSGRYRLKVHAEADLRDPSNEAKREFYVQGGFKTEEERKAAMLRDSFTKPTHYYAIASYLISDVQYTSTNYDANSIAKFSALGGTGRVGAGYQNSNSPWGAFGIVDLSGFEIDGQNFTFTSVEAHVTHKLEFGQSGLLLLGSGLFYKQLPIVTGSDTLGFTGVGKATNIGPHLGFSYWVPLNDRFGLQVHARAYYSLTGSAAGGEKTLPTLSYQYGLLGSYRLDRAWMGYAGYTFRHDQANYSSNSSDPNSFAQPGEINSVTIDGHYLNLILEYSF